MGINDCLLADGLNAPEAHLPVLDLEGCVLEHRDDDIPLAASGLTTGLAVRRVHGHLGCWPWCDRVPQRGVRREHARHDRPHRRGAWRAGLRERRRGEQDRPAFSANEIHVYRVASFYRCTATGGGNIWLTDATVVHEFDQRRRWSIEGFTYSALPIGISEDRWLRLLREATPGYAAQPYQHLAAVHRAAGHDSQARVCSWPSAATSSTGVRSPAARNGPGSGSPA